jgi:hypothetical protein
MKEMGKLVEGLHGNKNWRNGMEKGGKGEKDMRQGKGRRREILGGWQEDLEMKN